MTKNNANIPKLLIKIRFKALFSDKKNLESLCFSFRKEFPIKSFDLRKKIILFESQSLIDIDIFFNFYITF